MLSHPQAVVYQPMLRLLHHLATYQGCVDLRDRALLYLRLLTHAGSASLGTLFHPNSADVEQMTQMLTPVLPKTIRLVNGPVPFLRFFKSLDERKKLGILDKKCAVFVLPWGRAERAPAVPGRPARQLPNTGQAESFDANDWELRWGDSGDDHQFPREWNELAGMVHSHHPGTLATAIVGPQVDQCKPDVPWLLEEYRFLVQSSPASIRLPFVLQYEQVNQMTSEALDWLDCPRQLFSLELTFSSSEHFVPIAPIRIPFIAAQGTDALVQCGFPCMNKLLLKLQPISPVPTTFGVNIAFNDCNGHMYFGQLETFDVAFQDLFLPVRLPLVFWSYLFERLWMGPESEWCWSVKVLDLDRTVVQELIRYQLGPFIVPSEVALEEEDFDFEQEEYFERDQEASSSSPEVASGNTGSVVPLDVEKRIVLNVETVCTIVFIPPCHHLLMRFAISSHSTIVRILTDRFQLLSYMDAFFLSWSRDAAALAERPLNGGDLGGASSGLGDLPWQ